MKVAICAATALLLAGTAPALAGSAQNPRIFVVAEQDLSLPDPHRTPGAIDPAVTQGNIQQTICRPGYTKTVRPPEEYTARLKREQILAFGYEFPEPREYEEDHLIPLELGGAPRDPRNLWPEPYFGKWNARVKDRLEFLLHRKVCSGEMNLDEARSGIARNWIEMYKRFVGE
jgi:hypothetical protein